MKDTIDIEKVYDAHSRRLYNISLRITGSRGDAEEIMHDTLLQYWKFRQKEEIRDLPKWLTSICVRKSIDRLRDKSRWDEFLKGYEDPALEESPRVGLRVRRVSVSGNASFKAFRCLARDTPSWAQPPSL